TAKLQLGNASGRVIIGIAAVVGILHKFGGPGLVRRVGSFPYTASPAWFGNSNSLVGFCPGSRFVASRLPNAREIWMPVGRTRDGWQCFLVLRHCRDRRHENREDQPNRSNNFNCHYADSLIAAERSAYCRRHPC